jgi:hypothetical protein
MPQTSKSDRIRRLQSEQRDWLRRAIARSGLTPTEIARRGKITPSTLTRFLNASEHAGVLSPVTVTTVADITGEPPHDAWTSSHPGTGFSDVEATPYQPQTGDPIAEAVRAFIAGRDHLIPWELRTRALEPAGFAPGDVLIMDLNGEAEAGDVICAQIYDWQAGKAETVFRVLEPPFLVGAGDDAWRRPLLATDRAVAIKAVMLMSFRRRTARHLAAP